MINVNKLLKTNKKNNYVTKPQNKKVENVEWVLERRAKTRLRYIEAKKFYQVKYVGDSQGVLLHLAMEKEAATVTGSAHIITS